MAMILLGVLALPAAAASLVGLWWVIIFFDWSISTTVKVSAHRLEKYARLRTGSDGTEVEDIPQYSHRAALLAHIAQAPKIRAVRIGTRQFFTARLIP